ncbi:GalNAc-alpha-(1-_4)-GalNAc-alpha-(1-_3)-diNAcBac-PP-undecaprenol alpha-1,4-N-acetyl-D-galactosaminyltransferase [Stieleria maiorica]|uniref:GalNAc-alpha-(1->4)-GalNAc-alpha-(1->3)-diNAcBac-PP-undecaprenol alpha-1,4-N-acetyl-D-galactosaminyltransferase n=1 Tax=Stieleria maiorica TaxID=2795974 RepID=A0A5B9ME09_9BACT|nr:glycosyltransferase family 4 protein [Stieleria maiorica]QEF99043.1 GalNAc-alpha-(1->4)-GalNAc-alpha-(1->3)-diNAcBac-PP-undecaprenol alpha-1,4-N-acetyl-D-galactosaminyltransferase [Stieleria maiorica]
MSRDEVGAKRLSIACFIHSLNGGGAERVMAGLASRLALRGHAVTLVTLDDAQSDRHAVDSGVARVPLDLTSDAQGWSAKVRQVRARLRAIRDAADQISPDVILSFCDRTNIDVLLATGTSSRPVVVCERSDPGRQSLGPLWNTVRKHVYRRAASVVALTETSADYLRPFAKSVVVIPSAVNRPQRTSDRDQACAEKLIAGVGRLEAEKGFDRLLEAFARATGDDSDWRLVIYGDGTMRDALIAQAKRLGIADRFELPGWVRPLDEPLSRATMFCLPSRYEGFPSALLEAMSLGVPSLSVDCESGPRVIIDHGRNGWLVQSSVKGLSDGITRLIQDAARRESLGQAGIEIVNQFGWENMVDRYEQTLRDVVQRRP